MLVRRRERLTSQAHIGYNWINAGTRVQTTCLPGKQIMDDVVGNPLGDNPMISHETNFDPLIFNGWNGVNPGSGGFSYINYRKAEGSISPRSSLTPGHLQCDPPRDATAAISDGHPGQPALSIPNFLYELKDIPDMLKHAKDRAKDLDNFWRRRGEQPTHRFMASKYGIRSAGEDYLNYNFGWRPFFSDLADILEISKFLEKRAKHLSKIKGTELRTSGPLGQSQAQQVNRGQFFESQGFTASGHEIVTTTRKDWYSARWTVDPVRFGEVLGTDVRKRLKDSLGLDYALPVQFWEALPWSWFVDWFINAGKIINLMGNRQGVKFSSACIMTQFTTEVTMHVTSKPNWISVSGGGKRTYVSKYRTLFSPSFVRTDLGNNIFTPGHLATLSSLAVTRGGGSSRF